jgi:hypothetical protein
LLLFALFLWSFAAQAQVQCGSQPENIPPDVQQRIKGDVEGKAQIFTKLLGDLNLKGKVDASRNEVYQRFNDVDKSTIDRYMIWVSCQIIMLDRNLTTADKTKLWIDIYRELVQKHSELPSASQSVTSEDEVLNRDSKNLYPPWYRRSYWKNRGIWQDPDTYCDSLRGFIDKSTNASSFLYLESGRRVNLSRFSPGKIQGNFFIRSDPAFPGNFCQVAGRDGDFVVACSRIITRSALVFNSVYTRTLDNLRTCVGRLGWREDTSEKACTAAYIQARGACSRTFTRGPQDMLLYSLVEEDLFKEEGPLSIGIQIELENKKGPPVQGQYELVGLPPPL